MATALWLLIFSVMIPTGEVHDFAEVYYGVEDCVEAWDRPEFQDPSIVSIRCVLVKD